MKDRVIRIIKVLSSPHNEVVYPFYLSQTEYNSIYLEDDEVILCIWFEDDYEYQINFDDLNFTEREDLIYHLEQILLN